MWNLEDVVLNVMSQGEKGQYHTSSLIGGTCKHQSTRNKEWNGVIEAGRDLEETWSKYTEQHLGGINSTDFCIAW